MGKLKFTEGYNDFDISEFLKYMRYKSEKERYKKKKKGKKKRR